MSDQNYFQGWINPLVFFPLDEAWVGRVNEPLTADSVLKYLCPPGADFALEALKSRYGEVSGEPKRLIAAPAEDNILSKLVWPLRNAKASYVLGNYLGTISLCGMVCEMLTLLIYEISDVTFRGKPSDPKSESDLFGAAFERLGQERRVSILKSFNLIEDELRSSFELVRKKRRLYLHFFSQEHTNIQSDAVEVFNSTVAAVVHVIGQDLQDGKIVINPNLMKYLQAKGIAYSEPPSGVPAHNKPKKDARH